MESAADHSQAVGRDGARLSVTKSDLVSIRNVALTDHSFIFATWLRGLRYGNRFFNEVDSEVFYKTYHKAIETILTLPTVTVKVACLKDEPDCILGYAVYAGSKLHWVHVKKEWRRIGVANSLLPPVFDTVTHWTSIGLSILKKRKGLKFNPFDLF